ncbi:MAG TPA: DinB family protein [bacterium]
MVTQIKWFERKFNFDYPIGIFPCIIERLRGTPARLEELISSLPAKVLTIRVNDGWSIQEHVGHLGDLETLHDGRIDDFLANAKVLRAADLTNRKTREADHNRQPIKKLLDSFRDLRENFVKRLEELDEEIVSRSALHPRLKQPMRVIDMAFFTAEHDDHHVAKMVAIKMGNFNSILGFKLSFV